MHFGFIGLLSKLYLLLGPVGWILVSSQQTFQHSFFILFLKNKQTANISLISTVPYDILGIDCRLNTVVKISTFVHTVGARVDISGRKAAI